MFSTAPSPVGEGWGEATNTNFYVVKEALLFFNTNLKGS